MDNPWANAWGESPVGGEQSASSQSPVGTSSAWSAPSVSALHGDHEDDISVPSWSKEPKTWESSAKTSIWDTPSSSVGWDDIQPTYGGIAFRKSTEEELSTSFTATPKATQPPEPSPPASHLELPPPNSPPREIPSPPPLTRPYSPPVAPLADDDGFGTFETGDEIEEEDEWSSKVGYPLPSADANAWGDSWAEQPHGGIEQGNDTVEDEWTTTMRRRERQDRYVPPETLKSILQDLDTLSEEIWPDGSLPEEGYNLSSLDVENLDIIPVASKLIPQDLTLPANTPFSKTFVCKQMSEALKLTKNAPVTRLSPMTMFLASKGSLSWEQAVKARPNVNEEDIAPSGWKIVEQSKEPSSPITDNKRKGGSLFSFFGRKTTTSDIPNRSSSPSSTSAISVVKSTSSPRPSVDSVKSSNTAQSSANGRSTPSSFVVEPSTSGTSTLSTETKDATIASPVSADAGNVFEPAPNPPSAVSRFLGRFSSRSASNSSKESLSLTSDDLEFLSDAPTSPVKTVSTGFDSFNGPLFRPAPATATVSPPLLPPPLPPPPPKLASRPSVVAPLPPPVDDDLFSLYDSVHPSSKGVGLPPVPPAVPHKLPTASVPPPPIERPASHNLTSSNSSRAWAAFDFSPSPSPSPVEKQVKQPTFGNTKPVNLSSVNFSPPQSRASPAPPPKANTGVPFLPPPPSSRSQTPAAFPLPPSFGSRSQTPIIAPLQPPPGSRSLAQLINKPLSNYASTLHTTITQNDDDDFADFLSSPPPKAETSSSGFSEFSVMTPPQSLSQPTNVSNSFDDFDDFMQPNVDVPPALPAKPPKQSITPPNLEPSIAAKAVPALPSQPGHSRKVSQADHSRTLSLLESAASRGRWLGPPSPLPEALPPPGAPNSSAAMDLFGPSDMQAAQARAIHTMTSSTPNSTSTTPPPPGPSTTWKLQPPPFRSAVGSTILNNSSTPPLPSLNGSSASWTLQPPPSKPVPQAPSLMNFSTAQPPQPLRALQPTPISSQQSQSSAKGLSAQDLSFFEGL